ncbi:MAG TPA: hypothetical protein VJG64_03120 [Candidatus Paceibacterota bacterium]
MKAIARYVVIGALTLVAILGIPLIFPHKENPYTGKSVGEKSSLELKA